MNLFHHLSIAGLLGGLLLTISAQARAADLIAGQKFYLMRPAEGDATLETVPAQGQGKRIM